MVVGIGWTQINVSKETREKLRRIGRKYEKYDDVVRRLIATYVKSNPASAPAVLELRYGSVNWRYDLMAFQSNLPAMTTEHDDAIIIHINTTYPTYKRVKGTAKELEYIEDQIAHELATFIEHNPVSLAPDSAPTVQSSEGGS